MTAHAQINGWLTPQDLDRAKALTPMRRLHVIAKEVAAATGIPAELIMGRSRVTETVRARHLAWFIAHRSGMSFAEIGRQANVDHTTVIHGVGKEAKAREVLA